jgi:bifunctional aspartokinase / homoserine dehydrogenase 1
MGWSVHKFGGTSLGEVGRLSIALQRIAEAKAEGQQVALVVSALGHSTDWLLDAVRRAAEGKYAIALNQVDRVFSLAASVAAAVVPEGALTALTAQFDAEREPLTQLLHGVSLIREATPRLVDQVLSAGEWLSALTVAAALNANGCPALAVDAREIVVTDDNPQQANVLQAETQHNVDLSRRHWNQVIPVVTGFIGRSTKGQVTTLGRNGSDYTATLLAQALGSDNVTIWTDVPGVYTADPALVPEAYPVAALTYFEALELAHFGTRMFHARTMVPLLETGARLTIRSTREPERKGTRIDAQGHLESEKPTCVTSLEGLSLLHIESTTAALPEGLFGRILAAIEQEGIKVWMANQTGLGVSGSVLVSDADASRTAYVIRQLAQEREVLLGAVIDNVTLVTLVAERMGHSPNVAGRFFEALGGVGVKVRALAQGASQRSISCVVDARDTLTAVRSVHAAFNFAETQLNLAVLGRGTVGRALLAQIEQQTEFLRSQHGVRLKLVGLFDSSSSVFRPEGLSPGAALGLVTEGHNDGPIESKLEALAKHFVPVLVDCTASADMVSIYKAAATAGVHVVGANKKPLAVSWTERESLLSTVDKHSRSYLYETTCGAGLPVIETLKNLIRTGDSVLRIEGSLSGTLGFLCDALMDGIPLSVAIQKAREKGLTEPHPGDDLSGLDVARKALILARELGTPIELGDIVCEPFVPQSALKATSVDVFLQSLTALDASFAKQIQQLRAEHKVLRYLARIDCINGKTVARVAPTAVDGRHPAAGLRGEEAMVAFTTQRYQEYPLVVRGAGAGGDVTAAGVLADVLRLAQNLKGRRTLGGPH